MNGGFQLVGIREAPEAAPCKPGKWYKGKPVLAAAVLAVIVLGCLFSEAVMTRDPTYMDLANCNVPPCGAFLFGTDAMGRDIFSMIWYGGRVSLAIGLLATAISTAIAVVFGAVSGCAPAWLDGLLMRLAEVLLSVPSLLAVALLQAVLGQASLWSVSLAVGATGWMGVAKIVRAEVRQLKGSEFVAAARCMGGGFLYILRRHLAPNFLPSILFMVVMNIRNAMVAEATLSFMGLGLPLDVVSWGSMLSLAERSLGCWWTVVIPGAFLAVTLVCVADLGEYLRRRTNRQ